MDFLKNFLKNDKTVVGLCELKRKTTLNSFAGVNKLSFSNEYVTPSYIPGGALYIR